LDLRPPPRSEVVPSRFSGSEGDSDPDRDDSGVDADEPEPQSEEELQEQLRLLALVGTDDDPYKQGGPWAYADGEDCGGRCFTFAQNVRYLDTDRVLISEEQIEKGAARKGMTRVAWALHDRDVYTAKEAKEIPSAVEGERKADHYHVVIERKSFASVGVIARAFGVPPSIVNIKPQGSFLDCVEYLTHEHPNQQAQRKFHYGDEVVRTTSGWNWREELEDHKLARAFKAGQRADSKRLATISAAVNKGEMTLAQVREEHHDLWVRKGVIGHFQKMRQDFLTNQPPPSLRVNYYIGGPSETGKSVLGRLFARMLYPDLPPEQCYFEVGSSKVAFQAYDGQPVVIWDDYRAVDLLLALGDRGTVWRVFDTAPGRSQVNIKNGAVGMVQAINIVTGVGHYTEFLDGLAGQYKDSNGTQREAEDKVQSLRRFPFVVEITKEQILVMANKGFAGLGEYTAYQELARMQANMREVITTIEAISDESDREQFRLEVGQAMLSRLIEAHANARPADSLTIEDARRALAGRVVVEGPDEIEASRDASSSEIVEGEIVDDSQTIADLQAQLARVSATVEQQRIEAERRHAAEAERVRETKLARVRDADFDLSVLSGPPDPYATASPRTPSI